MDGGKGTFADPQVQAQTKQLVAGSTARPAFLPPTRQSLAQLVALVTQVRALMYEAVARFSGHRHLGQERWLGQRRPYGTTLNTKKSSRELTNEGARAIMATNGTLCSLTLSLSHSLCLSCPICLYTYFYMARKLTALTKLTEVVPVGAVAETMAVANLKPTQVHGRLSVTPGRCCCCW